MYHKAYDENIDPKEKIFKSASFTELKGKAEGEVLRVYEAKNGDEIIIASNEKMISIVLFTKRCSIVSP